jgi:hypothetical protein
MPYTLQGLGAIALAAFGIHTSDPEQAAKTKALEEAFAAFQTSMKDEVAGLRSQVQSDEGASEETKARVASLEKSVDAMGTDLTGLGTALVRAAPIVQPAEGNEDHPDLQPQTPAEAGDPAAAAGDDGAAAADATSQPEA